MKLLSRFNVSKDKGGPRRFSFEISMSGVISVGIVVVLGMCWIFILGILVGRGYKPEAAVPQIAEMMPTTDAAQPEAAAPTEPPKALKAEELQFMEGLHDKNADVVTTDSTQATARGQNTPMGAAAPAMAVPAPPKKAAADPPAKPAASKKDKETPKKDASKFTAVYQVASFRTKKQAEDMIKALSGKGYSPSLQEASSGNRTVFRVKIRLKGTDAEIAERLRQTGEKGPILVSKKPL